jgi:hypothetical protein
VVLALSLASSIHAHSVIINAFGTGNARGTALGVRVNTPRNSGNGAAQADTTTIRGNTGCGSTVAGGPNNIPQGIAAALNSGIAEVQAGGTLTMTVQIVNGDGRGPFNCAVDTTATGNNFQPIQMSQNSNSRNAPAPVV